MNYRPEIDGLRAIAVLPVILFHTGLEAFSGGFVGVDVFFVISGYLIATLIILEMKAGDFRLLSFYERRARRLLPALYLVLAVCMPFAWFTLIPADLRDFGHSLAASAAFLSNLMYAEAMTGYFDNSSEFKPLIHTWSLSLEEQFYVLFPLALVVLWRFGIKWSIFFLSIFFGLSFFSGVLGSLFQGHPLDFLGIKGAYYVGRLWEPFLGVLTAFYLIYKSPERSLAANQMMSLLGLAMVILSFVIFDKETVIPGFNALLPTVGTCLLIISTKPGTIVHHLLSFPLLVGIGLISYSAYLWHQPLLAFARHRWFDVIPSQEAIILCLGSFALAYISWRFVELPFRDRKQILPRTIWFSSLAGLVFFLSAGFLFTTDFARSNSPNTLSTMDYGSFVSWYSDMGHVCDKWQTEPDVTWCMFGDLQSDRNVVLYGDSHLRAALHSLDASFKKMGLRATWLTGLNVDGFNCSSTIFTGQQITLWNEEKVIQCPDRFRFALSKFQDADAFILLNRWSIKYFYSGGPIDNLGFFNQHLGCEEIQVPFKERTPVDSTGILPQTKENMRQAILNLLDSASSILPTLLVYPVPEVGCDPYRYNLRHKWATGRELETLSFPAAEYDRRNSFVIDIFDQYVAEHSERIKPVRLRTAFCGAGDDAMCSIIADSKPLYVDDDHVFEHGADLIAEEIMKALM